MIPFAIRHIFFNDEPRCQEQPESSGVQLIIKEHFLWHPRANFETALQVVSALDAAFCYTCCT